MDATGDRVTIQRRSARNIACACLVSGTIPLPKFEYAFIVSADHKLVMLKGYAGDQSVVGGESREDASVQGVILHREVKKQ